MRMIPLLLAATVSQAQTLPRVEAQDMTYLGSFALPTEQNGTSRFGYGGNGVSVHEGTLYIGGHDQSEGNIAQVRIPDSLGRGSWASLPRARWVQPFANVVEGPIAAAAGISTSNGNHIYGTLVYNGRLILGAGEYYGSTQQRALGYSGLFLGAAGDFRGFFPLAAAAPPRALGGPMAHVPPEWRAALGGPVIGGMWGTAIVSSQSAGPALTTFNPDSLGLPGHRGNTLALYPVSPTVNHTLCEGAACLARAPEATTNTLYNTATRFGGIAFPAGTRSVLLFGRQGLGNYCYGIAGTGPDADCPPDPPEADGKGPHAFPDRFQVWAYDASDLARVRRGEIQPWEVRPYAYWGIHDLDGYVGAGHARIRGAGYDPSTRRWYVTTENGERPRVDVFQIRDFGTPPPDTTEPEEPPPPETCEPDTVLRVDTVTVREEVIRVVRDTLYIMPREFRLRVEE